MAGIAHGLPIPEFNKDALLLIIEARYHAHINDMLLAGTRAMIERAGASCETLTVPGALEIPAAIKMAMAGGSFDGFVGLGCVIRGETTHYDLVSNESCRGLMNLSANHGLAIGNGILTVENEAQAIARANPNDMDKGGHAALAALTLIDWQRRMAKGA